MPGYGLELGGLASANDLPVIFDAAGFIIPRPRRHRRQHELQGLTAGVAELKMGAGQDRDTHPLGNIDNVFSLSQFAPKLTPPAEKVPNLLDAAVSYGQRHLPRRKRAVHRTSPFRLSQQSNLRAVGGETVIRGCEIFVCMPRFLQRPVLDVAVTQAAFYC